MSNEDSPLLEEPQPSGQRIPDVYFEPWVPTEEEEHVFAPAPPLDDTTISPHWSEEFLPAHPHIMHAMGQLQQLRLRTAKYDSPELALLLKKQVAFDWQPRPLPDTEPIWKAPGALERLNLLRQLAEQRLEAHRSRSDRVHDLPKIRIWPFQLAAALGLLGRNIVEMPNGAGKTMAGLLAGLTALPFFRSVHFVTINDYLAERDAQRAAMLAAPLGLSAFVLYTDETPGIAAKEYAPLDQSPTGIGCRCFPANDLDNTVAHILEHGRLVFAKVDGLVFAYLRQISQARPRAYWFEPAEHFLLADEADNILVDELSQRYSLVERAMAERCPERDPRLLCRVRELVDQMQLGADYSATNPYLLTDRGLDYAMAHLGTDPYSPASPGVALALRNALVVKHDMKVGDDYLVAVAADGQPEIVLIKKGRLHYGMTYNDGLQEAILVREGIPLASHDRGGDRNIEISLKNFASLYGCLAGMTATGTDDEVEYLEYFSLPVMRVPAWNDVREDLEDRVVLTNEDRQRLIVHMVLAERQESQRPILIACGGRNDALELLRKLNNKNITCKSLLAEDHRHESQIIAQAGQLGAVTVSAGMAGRGTDIRISPEAVDRGGLLVIVAGRSRDRREDEHLRGRAARHGLPGTSVFFLALGDELMATFAGPWVVAVLQNLGMTSDETIESRWVTRRIRSAQQKVKVRLRAERRREAALFGDAMERQRRSMFGLIKHFANCSDPVNETSGILQFAVDRWLDQPRLRDLRGCVRRGAMDRIRDNARFLIDVSGLVYEGEPIRPEDLGRRLFEAVWSSLMLEETCKDTDGIEWWRHTILGILRESWISYSQAARQRFEQQRILTDSADLLLAQYLDWCDKEFHRALAACGERCLLSLQNGGATRRELRVQGGELP